ncbi:cupin domain-containing protein [Actinoplanes sp. NPDC051861]|uniref:cupin domain-containing protein n=1 Tax=Actinoplanes sp. NPDC051861 TaxID=3155170 RepID=UPI00342B15B5
MEKTSLTALGDQQLAFARGATSGRSAETVLGGHTAALRQTVIAIVAGRGLDDHESPGEATLQVLRGHVRLTAGSGSAEAGAGELLVIPAVRHRLDALEDSVLLLTVVKSA